MISSDVLDGVPPDSVAADRHGLKLALVLHAAIVRPARPWYGSVSRLEDRFQRKSLFLKGGAQPLDAREELLSHFYRSDPFDGLTYTDKDLDYQGLSPDHPIFEAALSALRPSVILEIGAWKGTSAIAMAEILRRHNIDGLIICVDTWLGSPEHCLSPALHPTRPAHYDSLRHRNGYPQLYNTFMANVSARGLQRYILPVPNTSDNAFEMFRRINLKVHFVYIDAAHEYECVLRDISNSWVILRDGGIIVLDDYLKWPGVTYAVDNFAAKVGSRVYGEYLKAAIGKNIDAGKFWVPASLDVSRS